MNHIAFLSPLMKIEFLENFQTTQPRPESENRDWKASDQTLLSAEQWHLSNTPLCATDIVPKNSLKDFQFCEDEGQVFPYLSFHLFLTSSLRKDMCLRSQRYLRWGAVFKLEELPPRIQFQFQIKNLRIDRTNGKLRKQVECRENDTTTSFSYILRIFNIRV